MIKISQRIKEVRLEKGLTLEEISAATKIKEVFLAAIEEGQYDKLPSPAYAQGFVRNYVRFLGLPEKETLALFRREFDADRNYKVLPSGFAKTNDSSFSKFRLKQRPLVIILIFIAILGFIFYQYRNAFFGPSLDIFSPKEKAVFSSSVVSVVGKTDPDAIVFINDNAISVEQNGAFRKNIVALSGETTIKIKAVNHFGKQTIVKRVVEIKSSP
jgi:cytoskeletal protein RodZ